MVLIDISFHNDNKGPRKKILSTCLYNLSFQNTCQSIHPNHLDKIVSPDIHHKSQSKYRKYCKTYMYTMIL